jgi:hypothetical protein
LQYASEEPCQELLLGVITCIVPGHRMRWDFADGALAPQPRVIQDDGLVGRKASGEPLLPYGRRAMVKFRFRITQDQQSIALPCGLVDQPLVSQVQGCKLADHEAQGEGAPYLHFCAHAVSSAGAG